MKGHHPFTLEVIVCSVEDAIEAEKGGADRLEIISHFEQDGLTPPIELVRRISAEVSLPLRVMLRQSPTFVVDNPMELAHLESTIAVLGEMSIEGVVLGFLIGDQVNTQLTAQLLGHAPNLKATFHRAIDETLNPLNEIQRLKSIAQIDHVLSGGGKGAWRRRMERLSSYQTAASPEIRVLAGGGLNEESLLDLSRKTTIYEFHMGRAVRMPPTVNGKVKAGIVRKLVDSLNGEK